MHAMLNLGLGYTSAEHGRKRLPLVVDPILGEAAPLLFTFVTLHTFSPGLTAPLTNCQASCRIGPGNVSFSPA